MPLDSMTVTAPVTRREAFDTLMSAARRTTHSGRTPPALPEVPGADPELIKDFGAAYQAAYTSATHTCGAYDGGFKASRFKDYLDYYTSGVAQEHGLS